MMQHAFHGGSLREFVIGRAESGTHRCKTSSFCFVFQRSRKRDAGARGFIAYLTGNKEKALASFRRAMELDPVGYKPAMDAALAAQATAAYRKMLDDAAFVSQLPK